MLKYAFRSYTSFILAPISMTHWIVIVVMSSALMAFLWVQKKCSVYGAICSGITAFLGMVLLDAAVLFRLLDNLQVDAGFSLVAEYHRLIHAGKARHMEMLINVVAFIPFGFFLSEFLASTKSFSAGRRLGLVTLSGFGLSLTIECLQLLLHVGFFELTDLVMNTVGAFVGAGMSVGVRFLWNRTWKS